jgi:predicted dehydrogenase
MTVRRTGLLGFGHVAECGHLPAWQQRSDFEITAVVEPDPGRQATARQLLPHARIYDDAVTALEREDLDVVDIATPPTRHAPLTALAAAAGCHILCEKPLATSTEDYRKAIAAVRTAQVALCTVHNWKFSAQFQRLAELLDSGAIGSLTDLQLQTIRVGRAISVGSEWRGEAQLAGGGILIDHGWHTLYLLLGMARERPERISATIERRRYTRADTEDTVTCRIHFPSFTGEIYLTWAGNTRQTQWRARGTAGSVLLVDDRGEIRRGSEREHLSFSRSLSGSSHHPDWFAGVIDGFVEEIENPASRGQNLAEAETCLVLTTLAYASGARGGEPMRVPPVLPADAALPAYA